MTPHSSPDWAPLVGIDGSGMKSLFKQSPLPRRSAKKIQIGLQLAGLKPIILSNSSNWVFNLEVAVASRLEAAPKFGIEFVQANFPISVSARNG
ncbi:TPA: hypothetical protein ACK3Q6_004019 [Burkholderia cepacia]|jgi:hypothetical protein|uniref:Uncharacterized protein n=1 Tax=Burkholderia contaminans TaxID=488447 RepID=A0ABD7YE21_9BURK|nr:MULTISPECIES: hypothetical protein [Burkholderia cepacia complex]MBR8291102.1 hypothetical protein [Burkholderia cenocepacia]MBX3822882.1 hypothetical protein [Burkholderia contaminans]MBX3843127.1 hypothetical protein [Burkholderia contaminans]MBX3861030.1 hypothetical protein [Burkholderia contaminans]MBX3929707.1 hypothetical protein [Burkholderia contaminans]